METEVLQNEVVEQQPTTNVRVEELKSNIDNLHKELIQYEYHIGHISLLEKLKQFFDMKVKWKGEHVFELQEIYDFVRNKLNANKKEKVEHFGLSPYYLEKIIGLLYVHDEVGSTYIKNMSDMIQAFSSQRSVYLGKFTQLNLALEELKNITTNENNNEKQS